MLCFFFFKQKTAYELRISDWSSDVCSSDLFAIADGEEGADALGIVGRTREKLLGEREDNAPLAHIGVLRLVDEDVVGALVELEAHPFAEVADAQQRPRERDEIVEIGEPRLALGERIGLGEAAAEMPRCGGL